MPLQALILFILLDASEIEKMFNFGNVIFLRRRERKNAP
jgi:hypothetical protein